MSICFVLFCKIESSFIVCIFMAQMFVVATMNVVL
jgi:hypothetical protein